MILNNELLFLEITWRCNQNCIYCVRNKLSVQDRKKDMPYDRIVEALDKFPKLKGVIIIGAGEPLMHPEWDKIVTLLKGRDLMLQFSTNGVLLTPDKVANLASNTHVYVSFDTLDPAKYRKLRGGDIKLVLDNLPAIAASTHFALQPVITKGFINEVDLYMDLVNGLKAVVSPILPLCYSKEEFDLYYPSPSELRQVAARIKNRVQGYWNPIRGEPWLDDCTDPFKNLFVAVNGDVYACCYIYSARPFIGGGERMFSEYYPDKTLNVPADQYFLGNLFWGKIDLVRLEHIREKIVGTGFADFSMRDSLDLSVEHNYCRVCLNRWGCAG